MQPSTEPSTRWCVMWSLCELGELVCEPPMAPEPSSRARTREKQDWSWEERRGATGGHSGSPGMWIHYKYITITTTTTYNHGSGAGEEGTKHILQVLLSNIYQNNAHYIRYIPSYQTQNQKGCWVPPIRICTLHISLKFPEYWCCPPPLAWCSQCRGQCNTVTLSHAHGVMTNFVCLLMVTWTWWHLHQQPGHLFTSLPNWLHKWSDSENKESTSAWSAFILRTYVQHFLFLDIRRSIKVIKVIIKWGKI